jgi:hypothetical protein
VMRENRRRLLRGRPGARFEMTKIAVNAKQAEQAMGTMKALQAGEQAWRYLGPNCSTTVLEVLKSAGIVMPFGAVTPSLVHIGAKLGPTITALGAIGASGSAAAAKRTP